ncbi:branched-chain amino acid aminotransferase [Actinomycetospora sp. NBRC 106378]|uniref:branched-chain amino acid aminotransferase n=1 Tax=Actinomycetospora sp. NBRC 106378 TaxID=3032208 RepID=UPI0024A52F8D|nr:branched-chain amino acid aminotransferase [Actinomycetospora sp. NBRC 106378]GLZ53300.1 branched-chain-amino-acid aminotransferase [Actinomycetospora sp. NBRC 106378]
MSSTAFEVLPHPSPATDERVAEVLAAPGFGKYFTDHMVTIRWDAAHGWHDARVEPYAPLQIDPASVVLHYSQTIFEGLKAYRQPDGSIASFRPWANAARMARSAERLAMPPLPEELFLDSIRELLAVDHRWVPAAGGEESLYLRPFMIGSSSGLGVRPSEEYLYLLIASPAGAYFPRGLAPVSVWLSTDYVRAVPGGTGEAKCGGNYAASLAAQAQAAAQGCDQVVWLDALEHRWVEEMGGMNLFFVFTDAQGHHEVVTPELSGSLLPGITRRSLLELAREDGATVTERRISTDEWEKEVASGGLSEVFACGTAAVITPVGSVKYDGGSFEIGDGTPGPVTARLRERLTDIQRGAAPDPHGWMARLG